jgi:hypothetical protein
LALRLLKANLGKWENQAEILEFALRQPLTEKTGPLLAAAPRILGLSVSIWNHLATLELLRALEKEWEEQAKELRKKRPVIILGGPEVFYLSIGSEIIRRADWVIRGEGEAVFRDLCGLLMEKTPGMEQGGIKELSETAVQSLPSVKRVDGKIIDACRVDLAAIDPGYRLYTGEDLTRKLVYVEASRGCPFGCEFCLSSVETGAAKTDPVVREFPLNAFLKEMETLIRRGAHAFKFLDRSFNLDINRARQIMEFLLPWLEPASENLVPHVSISTLRYVHFEMVPARFPPELREILTWFPAGSLRLEVGIQTFNQKTATLIGRSSNPERELEVLRFLKEKTKALVHADLIAGLPGENLDSFAKGFDRLWTVQPTEIQLGILKCLPGAPISRHNKTYGMVYAKDPPYEVLETADLPAPDLARIKNFARFWELIVNRGAFAGLVPILFPKGAAVFARFMALSDWLFKRFDRNWGIDRKELQAALEEWKSN